MPPFSPAFTPDCIVDISEAATAIGFPVPVAISRVAHKHVLDLHRPPCRACEPKGESAAELMARILRTLVSTEASDDTDFVAFAVDIDVGDNVREFVSLRAEIGPTHLGNPALIITLMNEIYGTH